MKPWQELRAELIGFGFLEVLHSELTCRRCGDFRVAFLPDSEPRVICPKCCAPVDFAVLGRGLTRVLSDAICISPSLSDRHKGHREDPIMVLRCKQNTRRRRPEFLERARRELDGSSAQADDPDTRAGARAATSTAQPSRNPGRDAATNRLARGVVTSARVAGSNFENTRDRMATFEGYNLRGKEEIRSVMGTLQGSGSRPVRRDSVRSSNCCEKHDPLMPLKGSTGVVDLRSRLT